ncbi:ead/Ea22-like family protein [Klebsiella quasipneumoniae]|uniref:ead/Ea22-like family protein n=1 Tax=Klebsiella quasipneumoniae TaxID=1463165 RepID=UPI00237E06E1|nr:ead/Ea22-like family protein [Klebsiella quasipneumoniae]MDE1592371.1 ead/Ea22-like family protein [Klebsiella quasipneumoniae]HCD1996026.1 ead/Ea22-like family protein [Klebsiella quasipneumoniae]
MTTDITELAQRMKAAAEKATPGPWYVHDKPCEDGNYGIDTSDKEFLAEAVVWWGFARQSIWREEDAKYIALANPANILALVEALEKAQAAERRWHRVASRIHEQACESDVKIDELEAIRAAAEKLVRCKGRYHSEQNYRALAALFGVNTPDLPPLEHENVHYADAAEIEIAALRQRIAELESRTVKLPDLRQIVSGDRYVWSDGVYNYSQDVKVALAAAGIKVEAE